MITKLEELITAVKGRPKKCRGERIRAPRHIRPFVRRYTAIQKRDGQKTVPLLCAASERKHRLFHEITQLFRCLDRYFTELFEQLGKFERRFAGARARSLIALLRLEGRIGFECRDLFVDLCESFFHHVYRNSY